MLAALVLETGRVPSRRRCCCPCPTARSMSCTILQQLMPSGYRPAERAGRSIAQSARFSYEALGRRRRSAERARALADALLARDGKPAFAPFTDGIEQLDARSARGGGGAAESIAAAVVPAFASLDQFKGSDVRERAHPVSGQTRPEDEAQSGDRRGALRTTATRLAAARGSAVTRRPTRRSSGRSPPSFGLAHGRSGSAPPRRWSVSGRRRRPAAAFYAGRAQPATILRARARSRPARAGAGRPQDRRAGHSAGAERKRPAKPAFAPLPKSCYWSTILRLDALVRRLRRSPLRHPGGERLQRRRPLLDRAGRGLLRTDRRRAFVRRGFQRRRGPLCA